MLKNLRQVAAAAFVPFTLNASAVVTVDTNPDLVAKPASHTIRECVEGSQFIRNAMLSRNNGHAHKVRDHFESDVIVLRTLPKHLRWFIYTPRDEVFVRAWINKALASHQDPRQIEQEFLVRCQGYSGEIRSPFPFGDPNPM